MPGLHYALSLKQPWAALLASGLKTVEIRSWPTRVRGRVLIHAARVPDDREEAWKHVTPELKPLAELAGGVIGAAELSSCILYRDAASFGRHQSRHLNDAAWFVETGLYGFEFRKAEVLPFFRVAGNVKFFRVEVPEGT